MYALGGGPSCVTVTPDRHPQSHFDGIGNVHFKQTANSSEAKHDYFRGPERLTVIIGDTVK